MQLRNGENYLDDQPWYQRLVKRLPMSHETNVFIIHSTKHGKIFKKVSNTLELFLGAKTLQMRSLFTEIYFDLRKSYTVI